MEGRRKNAALLLYLHLAAGGNPAKAPFPNWELGRGAVRYFLETPPGWDPHAAFWIATLLAEGGERLVDAWGKDLPRPAGYHDAAFWRNFYRLLLLEAVLPDAGAMQLAIDRIAWLHDGAGPAQWAGKYAELRYMSPAFSFKGRTWRSLLRYLNNTFRQSFQPPAGLPEHFGRFTEDGQQYVIAFLDSKEALREEGIAMGHCLGNDEHVEEAMSGFHSFWSLRRLRAYGETERLATFTISDGTIVEMAGAYDTPLDAATEAMLKRWMEEVGIVEWAM